MWSCPVCGKENDGVFCAFCGFDTSRDYEHYPTLQKLNGRLDAISRLKETMDNSFEADQALETLRRLGVDEAVLESVVQSIRNNDGDTELLEDSNPKDNQQQECVENASECLSELDDPSEDSIEEQNACRLHDGVKERTQKQKKIIRVFRLCLSLVLWVVLWGHVFLKGIIHGNIMLAVELEDSRESIILVNDVLEAITGCTADANGMVCSKIGMYLNPSVSFTSLETGAYTVLACTGLFLIPIIFILAELLRDIMPHKRNNRILQQTHNRHLFPWNFAKTVIFIILFVYGYLLMIECIIPRFICGNIMIASQNEPVRALIKQINKAMTDMIGATKNDHGMVSLKCGIIINPSVSATSTLRGVGIVALCFTTVVLPVISAARRIIRMVKKCIDC